MCQELFVCKFSGVVSLKITNMRNGGWKRILTFGKLQSLGFKGSVSRFRVGIVIPALGLG